MDHANIQPISMAVSQGHPEEDALPCSDIWGSWEELILVSAVKRHGIRDWELVSMEVQARARRQPSSFTAEACKAKYLAITCRYSADLDRDGHIGSNFPWFEDLRKLRVDHLKRELEHHDRSIWSLQFKLKRLNGENSQAVSKKLKKTLNYQVPQNLNGFDPSSVLKRNEAGAGSLGGCTLHPSKSGFGDCSSLIVVQDFEQQLRNVESNDAYHLQGEGAVEDQSLNVRESFESREIIALESAYPIVWKGEQPEEECAISFPVVADFDERVVVEEGQRKPGNGICDTDASDQPFDNWEIAFTKRVHGECSRGEGGVLKRPSPEVSGDFTQEGKKKEKMGLCSNSGQGRMPGKVCGDGSHRQFGKKEMWPSSSTRQGKEGMSWRRSKKEPKVCGKLLPLLGSLRRICGDKCSSMFRHKQENQVGLFL